MKRIILLLTCIILFSSCEDFTVEKKHIITKFDKVITDTLIPFKDGDYSSHIIQLKGYTNDTIYITFGEKTFKKKFSGNIDTLFRSDYYGGTNAISVFNPYRATKGKLEVIFKIR